MVTKCALCGKKLEERGKFKAEFEVKQFGKDNKPVCKECLGKFEKTPQPFQSSEVKKK